MGKYIEKGICIWCLDTEPNATFNNEPHTISKQLGATQIGFDICDVCNHYFGTIDRDLPYQMGVELAFKEIMNLMRFLLKENLKKKPDNALRLRSIYFNYFDSRNTIQIKNSFKFQRLFLRNLTRQFKKGVYEMFLQEYHRITKNGLDNRFNFIRAFVRYDKYDLPLYYLENNGIYLIQEDIDDISLSFNENVLSDINDYGFYSLTMYGNVFFLEVTPRAHYTREVYLNKKCKEIIGSGFVFKGLRRLDLITDFDFTLRNLYK